MTAVEVNFDGLVGPTHNYGGLSLGNLASMNNLGEASNPRSAALQGISKMRTLMKLGLTQGVLPPHARQHIPTLRQFGFAGTDAHVLEQAWETSPSLVMNTASAAAMWTANAATISPSADTADERVHFTPANLGAMFHRSIEHETTGAILQTIFNDNQHFTHHPATPYGGATGDEGAANHGRLSQTHGDKGVELFVYGRSAFEKNPEASGFAARQSLEASQGIATSHKLDLAQSVFARQSAKAINAGAFHNDVVSVTNGTTLFYHADAFEDLPRTLDDITRACARLEMEPVFIEVPGARVSLNDAIGSYLFNSQLVSLADGGMALILPMEAEDNPNTKAFVDDCIANNSPIVSAHYLDVKQSMRNGGGPACLRLRVVLNETELAAIKGTCILTDPLADELEAWVKKHYRDRLAPDELGDPALLTQSNRALDELTQILGLGSLYYFQK